MEMTVCENQVVEAGKISAALLVENFRVITVYKNICNNMMNK